MTTEEVRDQLLDYIWALIDYWENETRKPGARDKLTGLAFSILAALDGCAIAVPGFIVAPIDANEGTKVVADVAGSLHECFHQRPRATNPLE